MNIIGFIRVITFRKSIVLHSNLFRWYPKCTPKYALAEISENELHKLNEQLGDAVYLGVKNKENVLYLFHFDSKKRGADKRTCRRRISA